MATTIKGATNGKALAWSITEDDLTDLEQMRGELLEKAAQAQTDGRLFMSSFYTQLAANIGPEVKRIRDRFDRETLANIRRELRDAKAEARAKAKAEQNG